MEMFKSKEKKLIIISIFLICLLAGFYFSKFYQPVSKTIDIYQQALKDYNDGDYSNAYYLFSKVGYSSKLKPVALYRQAQCAKVLGDEKSELRNYQQLFHYFPSNKLSLESKYQAAQLLIDSDPFLAEKYFDNISKSNIGYDYKIASEYYKSRIKSLGARYSHKTLSSSEKEMIEKGFRDYLEHAPNGRLALQVVSTWKKFNRNPSSYDKTLMARALYLVGEYREADEILSNTDISDSWAIQSASAYSQGNFSKVNSLVKTGVANYSKSIDKKDYKRAVNDYLKINNTYNALVDLLEVANGNGRDYVWDLKCIRAPKSEKFACYSGLYNAYPKGEFAESSLANMFVDRIHNKDFSKAKELGAEFLSKYPNSEFVPKVMFWNGKIEQKYYRSANSAEIFKDLINNYPDSYYAYRAFWLLQGVQTATISTELEYKNVVYPYELPRAGTVLADLMKVKDYEMLAKYSDDEFVRSWVEYNKGNYSSSMLIAKKAMEKLKHKPPKTDLRWRLVYPQNYYKEIKNYSDLYGNNLALMLSLVREESYFNPNSQSGVGAMGLMQIMPATAHEVGTKNGIYFNTTSLIEPELNLKLGNLYYATIKGLLSNQEASAIAAYNGGIGSVTRWKSTLQYADIDEFVEQIPYYETKKYVEKVFRSYWNYTRIYQK